jgi:hypothetical protein
MSTVDAGKDRRRSEIVAAAARELVRLDHRADGSVIQTPLLYPSGSYVVVRVDGGPERFLISDFGLGYHGADMMGSTTYFPRHARAVAEEAGVGLDQRAFFVLEVGRDQLAGAIAVIANCSHDAVVISALKQAEREKVDAADIVFERIARAFPMQSIARDAKVVRYSDFKWHVATLVRWHDHEAIFDAVTPHHASVVNAATKFNDIANLNNPPGRIAMVQRKANFKAYLNLLSPAASVVEVDASNEVLHRPAEAA